MHILATEIKRPNFRGYDKRDPLSYLKNERLWIGYRPHLEEMHNINDDSPSGFVMLQIIPYVIVKNGERILAYTRPDAGNEARLHGKMSVGVGGHIDLADVMHNNSVVDLKRTLDAAGIREISEEIGVAVQPEDISWTGVIYSEDGPVDKVHIGIVGEIQINDEQAKKIVSNDEIGNVMFIEPSSVENHMAQYDVESWSRHYLSLI